MTDERRDAQGEASTGRPVPPGPAFPLSSIWRGFKATSPVAVGVGAYGIALGLVAATDPEGISLAELLVQDVAVLAGSAQIVAAGLWEQPVPIASVVLATLIINLRYLLICATLQPLFEDRPLWMKLVGIHLVADENWAITVAEHRRRPQVPGFLLGGGLSVLVFWLAGCAIGFGVGGELPPPEQLGMDFAFTAAFIALALGFWRGRADVWPWLAAAASGVAARALLGGTWYILVGAVCGALVAALVPGPREDEPAHEDEPAREDAGAPGGHHGREE